MSQSQKRRRQVVVLSSQGFEKLQAAKTQSAIWNHYTKSCTLDRLSELTGLSTNTLSKVHARKAAVDLRTLDRYFSAFNLTLTDEDYTYLIDRTSSHQCGVVFKASQIGANANKPKSNCSQSLDNGESTKSKKNKSSQSGSMICWGMAPDVSEFWGRTEEFNTLKTWILDQRCRLVTLFGMGGIGKTWLATKLAEQLQPEFAAILWRRPEPIGEAQFLTPFANFLDDLLRHLTPDADYTIPDAIGGKIRQLLDALRASPCLLILDNVESILPEGVFPLDNPYENSSGLAEHKAYAELLRQLGQGRHQSCVVLTSRIEPRLLQPLAGSTPRIRSLDLPGLDLDAIQRMLKTNNSLKGSPTEWQYLVNYYDGNPFVLHYTAQKIQLFFGGSISAFLKQDLRICGEVDEFLAKQLSVLPQATQSIMDLLANQEESVLLSDLNAYLGDHIPTDTLWATLNILQARSLISTTDTAISVSPFVKDYLQLNGAS